MCTMIVKKVGLNGAGKGAGGWFTLDQVNVSYDHPFHVPLEHALNLDFVNEDLGPGARVAVELNDQTARDLAEAILDVLGEAERGGHLVVEST